MPEALSLTHEDDALSGEIHLPAGPGPFPGVLIIHSGLGLRDRERGVAAELAGLGYAALAADMFGGDVANDPAAAGAIFQKLSTTPSLLRSRLAAWLDAFAARPQVDAGRIAAIGYCFGGLSVLELARTGADIRAAVSFHGLLATSAPAAPGTIRGDIVAWCGGRDPYAPTEAIDAFRAEMAASGARSQVTVFAETQHGFTDPDIDKLDRPGIAYDRQAAAISWAGTLALLDVVLA